jgi:hypothetical protein
VTTRVLLVDSDTDALADAAAALRRRGYHVQIAVDETSAAERVRSSSFDVVVAPDRILARTSDTPGTRAPVRIVSDGVSLRMADVASVVAGVEAVSGPASSLAVASGEPREPPRRHSSGTLRAGALSDPQVEQGLLATQPLDKLVAQLVTARASGVIALQMGVGGSAPDASGSYALLGEIRLREGEVIEARNGRHSSMKAMARLLALREGRYVFRREPPPTEPRSGPGAPASADLFRAARQRALDTAHLRQLLSARGGGVFERSDVPPAPANGGATLTGAAHVVFERLGQPTALDELLEEPTLTDDAILGALLDLEASGRIVRRAGGSFRQPAFTDEEHVELAERLRRRASSGYALPVRIVFAATPGRLGGISHALGRFAESLPLPPPSMLVAPYPLARLSFAADVTLDLVALPLVPAYAPLWPLYVAGAHAVIVLDEAARQPLDAVCDERGIVRVEAAKSVGAAAGSSVAPEEISVALVASLVRRALDR